MSFASIVPQLNMPLKTIIRVDVTKSGVITKKIYYESKYSIKSGQPGFFTTFIMDDFDAGFPAQQAITGDEFINNIVKRVDLPLEITCDDEMIEIYIESLLPEDIEFFSDEDLAIPRCVRFSSKPALAHVPLTSKRYEYIETFGLSLEEVDNVVDTATFAASTASQAAHHAMIVANQNPHNAMLLANFETAKANATNALLFAAKFRPITPKYISPKYNAAQQKYVFPSYFEIQKLLENDIKASAPYPLIINNAPLAICGTSYRKNINFKGQKQVTPNVVKVYFTTYPNLDTRKASSASSDLSRRRIEPGAPNKGGRRRKSKKHNKRKNTKATSRRR